MEKITVFYLKNCPYCKQAIGFIDQLKHEEAYRRIKVVYIDEQEHPEIADKMDYYYVPTFYLGDEKVHEGVTTLEDVKRIFDLYVAKIV